MAAFEHKLVEPVEHFSKSVERVFLLEPRALHMARHGEPTQPVYSSKTGASYDVPNEAAIADYIDDLLSVDGRNPVDAGGLALFKLLTLQDGIALRDALLGFFVKARLSLFSKP